MIHFVPVADNHSSPSLPCNYQELRFFFRCRLVAQFFSHRSSRKLARLKVTFTLLLAVLSSYSVVYFKYLLLRISQYYTNPTQ